MLSLNDTALESNKYMKINFNGGDLSSDAGLLLVKEFACKLGFDRILKSGFKTNDPALFRIHKDDENLWQMVYQILGAYFEDDCADDLTSAPVLTAVLGKEALASQPILSQFFNRMDESTLLDTYGHREGEGFNFHYQSYGYPPLVSYDGRAGDLLKIELRNGTDYSCTGVTDFLKLLLDEFLAGYPEIPLLLRGDSGFATPDLYKQSETNGTSYVIRLKENHSLRRLAFGREDQAGSWDYPRHVVCKVEKQVDQLVHMFTFIVTNMDSPPEKLIRFYCKRGIMENFIKESKNGFDIVAVSSPSKSVNANRLQVHALVYNIFNWFKRLALSAKLHKQQIGTIRLKLLKIAEKVVRSARKHPESTAEAGITAAMNLDSQIARKRFHRDFIPFFKASDEEYGC